MAERYNHCFSGFSWLHLEAKCAILQTMHYSRKIFQLRTVLRTRAQRKWNEMKRKKRSRENKKKNSMFIIILMIIYWYKDWKEKFLSLFLSSSSYLFFKSRSHIQKPGQCVVVCQSDALAVKFSNGSFRNKME